MRLKYLIIIFFFLQVFSPCAFSQTFMFQHYTTSDGLSSGNISCLFQDSRGFIWIGTEDRLNKFDGYQFTVYESDRGDKKSLQGDYITDIFEDSSGNIWISTNNGLSLYNRDINSFTTYSYTQGLTENSVLMCTEDRKKSIWVATASGVFIIDSTKTIVNNYNHNSNSASLSSNGVNCILSDTNGNIWIGTENGLNRYIEGSNSFKHYSHNPVVKDGLSGNNITALYIDNMNRLWIGTRYGCLNLMDIKTETFRNFKHNQKNNNSLPPLARFYKAC